MVSLIVAMDRKRLIGRNGDLPWRLPNDLKHFKRTTLGKTILMGRKTWDSLGRPLPERDNWVLTRDPTFAAPGARVFHTLEDALRVHDARLVPRALTPPPALQAVPPSPAMRERGVGQPPAELMVIGGAELYRQALPKAHRIHLTEVDAELEGDTWFPEFDRAAWRVIAEEAHPADERHAWPYRFLTLERRA